MIDSSFASGSLKEDESHPTLINLGVLLCAKAGHFMADLSFGKSSNSSQKTLWKNFTVEEIEEVI